MNNVAAALEHPAAVVAGRAALVVLRCVWWFYKAVFWLVACFVIGVLWSILSYDPKR